MSNVCLITGIGHCGTRWLAHALNCPDQGAFFEHEMAYHATRQSWKDRQRLAVEKGVGNDVFPAYWSTMAQRRAKYRWVGDSLSWCPIDAVRVAKLAGAKRVIYLVRHGVQQLHSIAYHSTWGNVSGDHWLYHTYLRQYWELAGSPGKPWDEWSKWEKLCLWWASNDFAATWARDQLGDREVFVLRLEDLITKKALLQELLDQFYLRVPDIEALQKHDLNRKVPGDRSPKALWARWSSEERKAFVDICGSAMSAFDYDIPED